MFEPPPGSFDKLSLKDVITGLSEKQMAELPVSIPSASDAATVQLTEDRFEFLKRMIRNTDTQKRERRDRVYNKLIGTLKFNG